MAVSAVERVQESVHFECLADGADHDLDSACLNLDALATGTSADMLSEGSEEFDVVGSGGGGEHGVHTTEGSDESLPMVPVAPPFFVSRLHNASIDASPFSLEQT